MTRQRASSALALVLSAWIVSTPAVADAAERKKTSSDLEGTWFVLVHYKDSATNNADSDRWLDKVWTFDVRGSRLHWVEYPIVVLEDRTGRFEAYKGNPHSRVLAEWEPNEEQLAEIMKGPRINSRGSKSKTLRGSDTKGWKSTGRSRVTGANMMGFHENWSIEPAGEWRRFSFSEVIGNAVRGSAEGLTTYVVESGDADGRSFAGRYDRDGTRIGTFRIFRTPKIRPLRSSEEEGTVNERASKRAYDEYMRENE